MKSERAILILLVYMKLCAVQKRKQSKPIEKKLCVGVSMLENSSTYIKILWSVTKLGKRKRKVRYMILLLNNFLILNTKLYADKHRKL
ncbi:hypothetical protein C1646_691214 [Rhizophagus diaphanus]|nr:hypothetical protein C1646_691214 [Rhizophagus diaphanus] [Rhizophagus sp. MUCL 43196]